MASKGSKLGQLGERKIIGMIRALYPYEWHDDDSYYFDIGDRTMLVTTDSILKKTHIPDGSDPKLVGSFFAAINLSDIAAMGGKPLYFMSSLMLPKSLDAAYLVKLQQGIKSCLDKYGVKMAGGDMKQSDQIAMTGIAIGTAARGRMLKRNGSHAGDLLCVTGSLGKNAAGYYLWKRSGSAEGRRMLLEVTPRIREGILLSEIGATSAIDLSDGVYSGISHLQSASGNGFEVDYSRLPLHNMARKVSSDYKVPIEELALNFGGDYELLFTISRRALEKASDRIRSGGFEFSVIGKVTKGKNVLVKNNRQISIKQKGYEHFR